MKLNFTPIRAFKSRPKGVLIGLFALLAGAVPVTAQTTFNYTGAVQTYTVPAGVTTIQMDVVGARGGGLIYNNGGAGGLIQVTMTVVPGTVYDIYVGRVGSGTGPNTDGYGGNGTGHVGGDGSVAGGGGGGSTEIYDHLAATPFIVAGAGGGGSWDCQSDHGGLGGDVVGSNGIVCAHYDVAFCGAGGNTLSSTGGAAGNYGGASDGTQYNGGNSGTVAQSWQGGGGAGWYGGGGGSTVGSGGGGSSYPAGPSGNITAVTHTQGYNNSGDGSLTITPVGPANTTPTFLSSNPQTFSICQNGGATNITSTLHVNDTDASQTETWTVSSAPDNGGTLTGFATANTASSGSADIAPGNAVTYTPAPGFSGTESFTIQVSDGTSSSTITYNVTVNPLPSIDVISNNGPVCSGSTLSLSSSASGAATLVYSWHGPSGYNTTGANQSIPSVPVGANGTYTLTVTDGNLCVNQATTTAVVTFTSPIAGVVDIMANGTSQLTDATATGVWSSSDPTIATISTSGKVYATATTGTSIITYQVGSTCPSLVTVNVYPQAYCIGTSVQLADTVMGGTWSSTVAGIATANATTGLVTGVNLGTTTIKHINTGYVRTYSVTVNALQPVTGLEKVCQGAAITMANNTAGGGTWSTSNTALAAIVTGTGVMTGVGGGYVDAVFITAKGCMSAKNVLVNPTAPIVVPGAVCVGQAITVTNGVTGGTWSSSVPAMASISANTGMVYGIATGTPVLSYTTLAGCVKTASVTVNPLSATTGVASLCVGLSATMGNVTTGGGTWSSTNTAVAGVVIGTGVTTAVGAGNTNILFTTIKGCVYTKSLTVNAVPTLSGIATVCVGQTTQLSSSVAGGTWNSSIPGMAGVNTSTGLVSGVSAGTPVISYGLSTGCNKTVSVTVNPLVASTGSAAICQGHTVTLANSTSAGTWTSSNTTIATVGVSTGVVTGVAAGSVNIKFNTIKGCVTSKPQTVSICPAREGNTTSAQTITMTHTLQLFPNPNTGTFTLSGTIAGVNDQEVNVVVMNMLGQEVYHHTFTVQNGAVNEQINMGSTLPAGNYLLNVRTDHQNKTYHFAVSK